MEIMVLREELDESFSQVERGNPSVLIDHISESPEDYIFILSIEEWGQWVELHQKVVKVLRAIKSDDEWWKRLSQFAKENEANPSSLISIVSVFPDVRKSFKIGSLTQDALGDCCAVFFTRPRREQKRADEVLKLVLKCRAEPRNKPPTS